MVRFGAVGPGYRKQPKDTTDTYLLADEVISFQIQIAPFRMAGVPLGSFLSGRGRGGCNINVVTRSGGAPCSLVRLLSLEDLWLILNHHSYFNFEFIFSVFKY